MLHFEGYISEFLNTNSSTPFYKIREICETILFLEFDIVPNSGGYISFERNTNKQLHEYCYDILNEFSNPLSITEMARIIAEKYPDVNTTTDSIRGSLNREKETFIHFGRSSTYGLRKWENEKENLKGGTIRDIVEGYLKEVDTPKHISEITQHVLKYRDTNEKSVLTNIKVDEKNRFAFFKNSMIGLTYKKYLQQFTLMNYVVKTWEQKFEELKSFRIKNADRWPSYSADEKIERSLYIFCRNCRKSFQTNRLEKYKEELFLEIGFPLGEIVKNEDIWQDKFKILVHFIINTHRMPRIDSDDKTEQTLYKFYHYNNRKFKKGLLREREMHQYTELQTRLFKN